MLEGPDHRRVLERLLQGQRPRLDAPTCTLLGISPEGSEHHALVDRAAGCMLIVRRDPEQLRLIPIRTMRFAPAGA